MQLAGEPDPGDAPEAAQLCAADSCAGAAAPGAGDAPAAAALAWTQAADGLLCADAAGWVAMHRLVSGAEAPAALVPLWRARADGPQARPARRGGGACAGVSVRWPLTTSSGACPPGLCRLPNPPKSGRAALREPEQTPWPGLRPSLRLGLPAPRGGPLGETPAPRPAHRAARQQPRACCPAAGGCVGTYERACPATGPHARGRQALLSAGAHAFSPAASAATGAKVVTVWWPPLPAERAAPAAAEAAPPAAGSPGFSAETRRLLRKLSPTRSPRKGSPRAVSPRATGAPAAGGGGADGGRADVAAEELRHPAPVVSLQWSPGVLQTGACPPRPPPDTARPPEALS